MRRRWRRTAPWPGKTAVRVPRRRRRHGGRRPGGVGVAGGHLSQRLERLRLLAAGGAQLHELRLISCTQLLQLRLELRPTRRAQLRQLRLARGAQLGEVLTTLPAGPLKLQRQLGLARGAQLRDLGAARSRHRLLGRAAGIRGCSIIGIHHAAPT
eukprot:scaffold87457_cov54-Phaeocystis_antarctica.AAC.1